MIDLCGCRKIEEPFEFEIQDTEVTCNCLNNNKKISSDNFCLLKNKIISEYLNIINKLKCGIKPDLELILQEISLIYIYE